MNSTQNKTIEQVKETTMVRIEPTGHYWLK
jgi:hypothetical protein